MLRGIGGTENLLLLLFAVTTLDLATEEMEVAGFLLMWAAAAT
jgi:hypothetical protein